MSFPQLLAATSTIVVFFLIIFFFDRFDSQYLRNRYAIILCVALVILYLFTLPLTLLYIPALILVASLILSRAID